MTTLTLYLFILLFFVATATHPSSSLSSSWIAARARSTSQPSRSENIYKSRSACRLFIWDAISACRYHLCNRLLRDRVYEGLGGKKFVRIKPGSLLESLYPPSKHGPDKCLLCGLSFHDHLKCWWYPQLYSPYDRHLDEVMNGGDSTLNDNDSNNCYSNGLASSNQKGRTTHPRRDGRNRHKHKTNSMRSRQSSLPQNEYESGLSPLCSSYTNNFNNRNGKQIRQGRPLYHTQYVRDLSSSNNDDGMNMNTKKYDGKMNKKKQKKPWGTKKEIDNSNSKLRMTETDQEYEIRNFGRTVYSVPKMTYDREKDGKLSATVLLTARILVLAKLDQLLWIQKVESL